MRRIAFQLFAAVTALLAVSSCTYNYFDGTRNYRVFVPEVRDGAVTDCHILIYDLTTGAMAGMAYADTPGASSESEEPGVFAFKLAEGDYKVCVITGTDSVTVEEPEDLSTARFCLKTMSRAEYLSAPGPLYFDYISRSHDGVTEVTDTAAIRPYPARIDVRYRSTDYDINTIKSANMVIDGVADNQTLALDTIPGNATAQSSHFFYPSPTPNPIGADGAKFQFTAYIFPTAPDALLTLHLTIFDGSGAALNSYSVDVTDRQGVPVALLCGERAIVDIYNDGINISINGWSSDIAGGSTDINGGKDKTDPRL